MFKMIGIYTLNGTTILIGLVKTDTTTKFGDSGFNKLLECDTTLVDDIRTVYDKAPANANFAAIIDGNGKVTGKYLRPSGGNQ